MTTQLTVVPASDFRSQRGRALAQTKRDAIKPLIGSKYLVPSATGNGSSYVVDTKAESCTCLDWAQRGGHDRPHRCKHIWATLTVLNLADGSELIVPEKPKKCQRDWKATNACRSLIPTLGPQFCAELVDGLELAGRVPGEPGRPEVPLRDVLLTALIRVFERKTAAAACVAARNYCELGIISMSQIPSYNTLLREFARPEHMPILHRLLAGSAYR